MIVYPLTVEFVGKVPGFDWLTKIVVRLPDNTPGVSRLRERHVEGEDDQQSQSACAVARPSGRTLSGLVGALPHGRVLPDYPSGSDFRAGSGWTA